jgi:predicted Rossmann fold flavoprotein
MRNYKAQHPKQTVSAHPMFDIPRRLWERLTAIATGNYADLSNKQFDEIIRALTATRFLITGKSTNKEEFVTAGGVSLKEVDFKTMMSRKFPNLYFAGEVLDIDAITGGFNFQAAWTTGWIAGNAI